jgi:hypothetical protein
MISVISEENTTMSTVSTISTGPAAAAPSSTTSIGTPRKPVLPDCAGMGLHRAFGRPSPRNRATARPRHTAAKEAEKIGQHEGRLEDLGQRQVGGKANSMADSAK